MARSRNIKPSFFTNDILAENSAIGRLLFIGLWTVADYKGEIEWRPKKIKAQILPFDDCDVNELAINLDKSGFIRFYSVHDILYVKVVNFQSHQNPHINEKQKGSDIPAFDESSRELIDFNTLTINPDKSRLVPDHSHTHPADSLILIPDSLKPINGRSQKSNQKYQIFELQLKPHYPKREGSNPWKSAAEKMNARLNDGVSMEEMIEGTKRYHNYCAQKGWIGTSMVMQAQRFYGVEMEFRNAWGLSQKSLVENIRWPANDDCAGWIRLAAEYGQKPLRAELQIDFVKRMKTFITERKSER